MGSRAGLPRSRWPTISQPAHWRACGCWSWAHVPACRASSRRRWARAWCRRIETRRAADGTAWRETDTYDLIVGADILDADSVHAPLRRIFESNLAPGGGLLLSDPFRSESLALLEAMNAEGWNVAFNKWTVGVVPPPRPIGVFELTRRT